VIFERLGDTLHPADQDAKDWLLSSQEGDRLTLEAVSREEVRTTQQGKAIEVYCRLLADALNAAGYDMKAFPWRQGLDVPWTQSAIKERFWKPTQDAMLGKKSSTQLQPKEVNVIYEAVDAAISDRTGVHVEFPNKDWGCPFGA